jgi:Spy/CpxP family protein refolding chaperone
MGIGSTITSRKAESGGCTMKKFSRLFLVGIFATALFLGYGLAKADDSMAADNQSGDQPAMNADHPDHMDHDGMGKGRIEHLKEKLGLTDDQATQLKEAFKKQEEAIKPLRDQEKIDVDMLQQKVDTKASDSDIKALLDKLKEDHKTVQDAQERSMDKMRTILNPTQQAKWVLSMRDRMGAWGRRGWDHKKDDGKKDGVKKHKKAAQDADAQPTPADAASN